MSNLKQMLIFIGKIPEVPVGNFDDVWKTKDYFRHFFMPG